MGLKILILVAVGCIAFYFLVIARSNNKAEKEDIPAAKKEGKKAPEKKDTKAPPAEEKRTIQKITIPTSVIEKMKGRKELAIKGTLFVFEDSYVDKEQSDFSIPLKKGCRNFVTEGLFG